jgi:Zn-dependent peptidase ImmA (M78 family)/transcriptional regulator with XRE-family HTH domain
MVTLARQSRGITQAALAARLHWVQGTISKIENRLEPLSGDRLAALADALDYPIQFFLRRDDIAGPGITELYHRKKARASATVLHRIHAEAEIRRFEIAVLLQSWDGLPDEPFPTLNIDDFEGKPEKIARTTRAMLHIPPGPLFSMTKVVESAGGIVMSCDFGTSDVDAFSRWRPDTPPIFFMNSSMPPDRWRFALAHELGHIVMHSVSGSYPQMEHDAHLFAGEFLAPKSEIKPQLFNLTLKRLAPLKEYWKMSMQALVMRAYTVGSISNNGKRYMLMQLSKAGYRLREPQELDPPPEPPELIGKIVAHHRRNLGYSDDDLCRALAVNNADLYRIYQPDGKRLHAVR